jgi:hypothetical protein
MLNLFFKNKRSNDNLKKSYNLPEGSRNKGLFTYSWILTGKLAIGPMPRDLDDWILLEQNGIKKRFSCCYSSENIFTPIPSYWISKEVSIPDHRRQEEMKHAKLLCLLDEVIGFLMQDEDPVYLHCFAGQERSALVAIGIVSILEKKDLFDALAYVRQCYPKAKPLYEHLDILEKALNDYAVKK